MSLLSLAIVTFNSEPSIKNALDSLMGHLPRNLFPRVIIVDNRSTDRTVSIIQKYSARHRNITLIGNGKNVGFGRAHNQALAAVASHYHAICNPDILVSSDIFTPLVDFMESHPHIGLCCPKFLNPDGTLQHLNRRLPTMLDLFLRRLMPTGLRPYFKQRLESYEMREVGYEHSCDVPFVSGAFMFCRTQVLREVGGFDERFFLYFEDADLSRQVQNHGYRTVFFPEVSVIHEWKRIPYKNLHGTMIFLQAAYLYFRKWGFKWC